MPISSKGHGFIVNLGSYLPFIFTYNPTEVTTEKDINYFEAPNVGGSHHKMYFTGFSNKKASFTLDCIDMENPFGVLDQIAYFECLREPDAGLLGIAGSFFGNENYPPPQVLFNFGTGAIVPLVWDVGNIDITASLFYAGKIRGVMGIPKRAIVSCEFILDENSILFKANQIAKKMLQITGSALSMTKEVVHQTKGKRKEQTGILPNIDLEW